MGGIGQVGFVSKGLDLSVKVKKVDSLLKFYKYLGKKLVMQ
jgi:hypothetical protein